MGFGANLLGEFRAGRTLAQEVRSGFGGQPTQAEQLQQSGLARSLLQERIGQGQIEQQQAEIERFTERTNLESVFNGAIQASRFTDEASQNQFLEARIAEGQRQGRDMRDSIDLLRTPFPQRAEILRDTIELGFQQGQGRRPPRAPQPSTPAALQRFTGLDEAGNPATFSFDPRTRETVNLGITPVPKAGTFTQVRDPVTGEITFQTGTGQAPQDPTFQVGKKLARDLQKEIITAEIQLSNLDAIGENIDDSFLTFRGATKSFFLNLADKAEIDLSPEQLKFVGDRVSFRNDVKQFFNRYRKEITGAAAAEKELKDLQNSIVNIDLGPQAFRSAFVQIREKTERIQKLRQRVLREGVPGGFENPRSPAAARLDELFIESEQNAAVAADPQEVAGVAADLKELMDLGMTQQQAMEFMFRRESR